VKLENLKKLATPSQYDYEYYLDLLVKMQKVTTSETLKQLIPENFENLVSMALIPLSQQEPAPEEQKEQPDDPPKDPKDKKGKKKKAKQPTE